MGRVWLKTKYDNGMQMEIPHSHNMANAFKNDKDFYTYNKFVRETLGKKRLVDGGRGKYGSARAWKRIADTTEPEEGFMDVSEQMEITFDK